MEAAGVTAGEEEVDSQECVQGSAEEPVTCTFDTPVGGQYQVTAVVLDEMGNENRSQMTRWVSGGDQPPSRNVETRSGHSDPVEKSYQPGDVAEILVQAPFTPAEGLLTVSRSGILYTERFKMDGDTEVLRVPIAAEHIPNLHIQVDLVGATARRGQMVRRSQTRPAAGVCHRPA